MNAAVTAVAVVTGWGNGVGTLTRAPELGQGTMNCRRQACHGELNEHRGAPVGRAGRRRRRVCRADQGRCSAVSSVIMARSSACAADFVGHHLVQDFNMVYVPLLVV